MTNDNATSGRRAALLCCCLASIALLWCVVLPVVSQQNGYGVRTLELERQGIDPGAMFYTEHSRMLDSPPQ